MPLPIVPLPETTIDVGGQQVTIRSLSRGERLELAASAMKARDIEAFIVGRCTDTPDDVAKAWLASVQGSVADGLIRECMLWSGMIAPLRGELDMEDDGLSEDANAPEDPSSGSTEEPASDEPSLEP